MKEFNAESSNNGRSLTRKQFLAYSASAFAGAPLFINSCVNDKKNSTKKSSHVDDPALWWKMGRYIVHETVDTSFLYKGRLKARVEGTWQEFTIKQLPKEFVDWSLSERVHRLERLAKYGFQRRDLAGP
ncbi:MAG: hypothetical protein JXA18_06550 [Chitinispirillaceae bacterium]|nr:hypothetical protein [Chitinispirillaceae bacterium]